MEGLAAGAGLFYNGTSSSSSNLVKCFNTKDEYIECADPTGCGLGNDAIAWDYQVNTYGLTISYHKSYLHNIFFSDGL